MAAMSRLLVCSLAMAPAQLALGFNCGTAAISANHARRAVHHSARLVVNSSRITTHRSLPARLTGLKYHFVLSPARCCPLSQTRLHAEGSRQPVTPDFTTSVDLDSVKLAKPKRPEPSKSAKWVGLEGLDQRTAGSLIPETLKEVSSNTLIARFISYYIQPPS
eukprot:15826-Heterococcus_DN1.PRE.1